MLAISGCALSFGPVAGSGPFELWGCPIGLAQNCWAAEPAVPEGVSSREVRLQAARGVPIERLSSQVSGDVREVLDSPSYFRRMPSQQIACDPHMFTFLVRRPEVMVNIWEVMGITKVKAQRTSPFTFLADDGVGTACKCDLVFSNGNMHIYFGNGTYDGTMAPRKVTGRCVCILRTENHTVNVGSPNIVGTMDVFLKVDNFGADLLTRTIGPFVGKTADYNFVETAKFIAQISLVCQNNPSAAQALVGRLDRVDDATRREFGEIVTRIASTNADLDSQLTRDDHSEPKETFAKLEVRQTVPPMDLQLSDSAPVAGSQSELLLSPSAIRPSKPHIYMRR